VYWKAFVWQYSYHLCRIHISNLPGHQLFLQILVITYTSADLTHLEHEFGAKVDLKAHGIAEGFILEGKTVRLPLSFEHKSELKLLNEKRTTYKLHSYLNEKTAGKCLILNYHMGPFFYHNFEEFVS
jgi:hypothetical protein